MSASIQHEAFGSYLKAKFNSNLLKMGDIFVEEEACWKHATGLPLPPDVGKGGVLDEAEVLLSANMAISNFLKPRSLMPIQNSRFTYIWSGNSFYPLRPIAGNLADALGRGSPLTAQTLGGW